MAEEPKDHDLLLPFEMARITGDYGRYFKVKRQNFFSTISRYPQLWEFFRRIDEIWSRELDDLKMSINEDRSLPLILYASAHAKIRISAELAFSTAMSEARSVLRDAVESVAHAHHLAHNPENGVIWLQKDDGPEGLARFKKIFEEKKRFGLFKGLEALHTEYGDLSEAGSHPTMMAFHNRLTIDETHRSRGMTLEYLGVNDEVSFVLELFTRLLTVFVMEQTLFEDYKVRLQLDIQLMQMRESFEAFKEQLRKTIIKGYDVKPPAVRPYRP